MKEVIWQAYASGCRTPHEVSQVVGLDRHVVHTRTRELAEYGVLRCLGPAPRRPGSRGGTGKLYEAVR